VATRWNSVEMISANCERRQKNHPPHLPRRKLDARCGADDPAQQCTGSILFCGFFSAWIGKIPNGGA
jgi:hypothetical protein